MPPQAAERGVELARRFCAVTEGLWFAENVVYNPSVKNFVFATSLYTREAIGFCNTYLALLCKRSCRAAGETEGLSFPEYAGLQSLRQKLRFCHLPLHKGGSGFLPIPSIEYILSPPGKQLADAPRPW